MPLTRVRVGAIVLLLLVSGVAAAAFAFAAWHLLPYEVLERETAAERFLLWEAVMWMIGIALALFGAAAWFGTTDMYARYGDLYMDRPGEHTRRQLQQGIRGELLFSDLAAAPWLMMGTGTMLLVLAVIMRMTLFD